MAMDNAVPVSEAARILDVHPSRVRAMVGAGQLDAQKLAGRWFINRSSLEQRCSMGSPDGRPLSPINAWALLCLADGNRADWVDRSVQSRLRGHMRRRSWEELVPRLRSRADAVRLRAHPAAIDRLANEKGVVLSGVSVADRYNIDIVPSDEIEAYVYHARAQELIQQYMMEPSGRPNVILHVVPDEVPSDWQDCVSGHVAALDLLESLNARSQRAGNEYIHSFAFQDEVSVDDSPAV